MRTLWELYLSFLEIRGLMLLAYLFFALTAAIVVGPIVILWLVIESR